MTEVELEMESYQVASLSVDIKGRWTVTYYGDVPEQGGIQRTRGQLTFYKVEDACTFLQRELSKQTEYYLEVIAQKTPK